MMCKSQGSAGKESGGLGEGSVCSDPQPRWEARASRAESPEDMHLTTSVPFTAFTPMRPCPNRFLKPVPAGKLFVFEQA